MPTRLLHCYFCKGMSCAFPNNLERILHGQEIDQACLKSIPVIVVSQLGVKADIDKVMKLGAAQYLVKSEVMFKDIVRAVRDKIRG